MIEKVAEPHGGYYYGLITISSFSCDLARIFEGFLSTLRSTLVAARNKVGRLQGVHKSFFGEGAETLRTNHLL